MQIWNSKNKTKRDNQEQPRMWRWGNTMMSFYERHQHADLLHWSLFRSNILAYIGLGLVQVVHSHPPLCVTCLYTSFTTLSPFYPLWSFFLPPNLEVLRHHHINFTLHFFHYNLSLRCIWCCTQQMCPMWDKYRHSYFFIHELCTLLVTSKRLDPTKELQASVCALDFLSLFFWRAVTLGNNTCHCENRTWF